MRIWKTCTAFALGVFAMPQMTHAQDDEASESASDDDTETLLAYLGLSAATGTTSVGEGAGSTEAFILTTHLARLAADKIVAKIDGDTRYLLTDNASKFDFTPYFRTMQRIDNLALEVDKFSQNELVVECLSGTPSLNPFAIKGLDQTAEAASDNKAFDFKVTDVLGAIKVDRTISPIAIDLKDRLLMTAILARRGDRTVLTPDDVIKPVTQPDFSRKLDRIEGDIAPFVAGKCDSELSSDKAKKVKEAATAISNAASSFKKPGKDGAPSAIENAESIAGIFAAGQGIAKNRVLRVSVEKAGGTMINNSSIWTSLGVPGTTVRGGLVVSYRAVDPQNGLSDIAGVIACNHPKRLLMDIASADLTEKLGGNCFEMM